MNQYEVIIYFSKEDNAFIAVVPELPGFIAHGTTNEIALKNVNQAMDLWLETAKEFNDFIPVPKGRRLLYA
jgi:predicted RNase H-like HicB family nuclease